jgi:hypothetical protein
LEDLRFLIPMWGGFTPHAPSRTRATAPRHYKCRVANARDRMFRVS